MAVLDDVQFAQLVTEVKKKIQTESQGVGEVPLVDTLDSIYSLPALQGEKVVEAPLELLSRPAVEAAGRVDEAIASAMDTANHPTYIGTDNYVYVWDKENQTYNKTTIYVRGESFSISKVYASIEEMEADTEHGLKEGDFVLINTGDVENPENAQIFVLDAEGKFQFLVDMSGAIGFTGKTPQIEIGEITVGENRSDAVATLSDNGTDDGGNPKYLLNLKIPALTVQDMSEEEIALLQQPAADMIAQLEETDATVKANEEVRISAEEVRVSSEEERVLAETGRTEAETVRDEAEAERLEAETIRKAAETARISNEETRLENEEGRVMAENARVVSENSRVTVEQSRVLAESSRVEAEAERKANENVRQIQEQNRESNESVRKATENTRIEAEAIRQENESKREQAESTRKTNEEGRVEAEEQRKADYAVLREDILAATDNANDAAAESRNTPVIKDGTWWIWDVNQDAYADTGTPATSKSPQVQNGTWWTWDDDKGVYVDTGQSVSADYVLTREKIEGVFQGNVESHWHDRYVDKVDGKGLSTEDFTTEEKEKLAGLENYDPTALEERIQDVEDAMPTKVSDLENDAQYVTAAELESKTYATTEELSEGLDSKQEKNLYFSNVVASQWVLEGTFSDFKYRCDIPCEGVTENHYAVVTFGLTEAMSSDYAPICSTSDGVVTIWSSSNKAIVVPTIIINK